jgi:hypothetical protein
MTYDPINSPRRAATARPSPRIVTDPGALLRRAHRAISAAPFKPVQAVFQHSAPQATAQAGQRLRFLAEFVYPGCVRVYLGGDLWAASEPGAPLVEAPGAIRGADRWTAADRRALLAKAAAALAPVVGPEHRTVTVSGPAPGKRPAVAYAVFTWPGTLQVQADPITTPDLARAANSAPLAVSLPGYPTELAPTSLRGTH